MAELTQKRREILEFIETEQRRQGFAPSVREIAEAVQLASPSSVQHHIEELVRGGYIQRSPAKPRTLTFPKAPQEHHHFKESLSDDDSLARIPLLGDVAAGTGTLALERPDSELLRLPRHFVGSSNELFMLVVRGESMIDIGIYDGDHIVVRQQSTARNGDLVVAAINDGEEGTVKVFRSAGGRVFLEARNESDPRFAQPIEFESERDRILGLVVALLRRYE